MYDFEEREREGGVRGEKVQAGFFFFYFTISQTIKEVLLHIYTLQYMKIR